jgi:hypothetical protein
MLAGIGKKKRGFILITSAALVAILVVLILAYIARIMTESRFTTKFFNSIIAFDLAEAGVDYALWEMNYNGGAFGGWSTSVDGTGNTTRTTTVSSFKTSSGQTMGDFSISVYTPAVGNPVTITSTGYAPNMANPDEGRTTIVEFEKNYQFTKATIGNTSVSFSGQAKTDSYDSALGTYGSQTPGQQGSVASNGPITLSGSAYINGDANPGPSNPFSGTPPVSGSYATLQAPIQIDPIPPANIAAAQVTNNNASIDADILPPGATNLVLSSSTPLVLAPGTYYFTSMSISGEGGLQITGPTTIYVDGGNVAVSGKGFLNTSQPKNLLLLSTGPNIDLSGQSTFIGTVYAPVSTVKLSGQDNFYGAIVCGKSVDVGQAKIHFDVDLLKTSPSFGNYKITYWQEKT